MERSYSRCSNSSQSSEIDQSEPSSLYYNLFLFHRELNGLSLHYFAPVVNLDSFHCTDPKEDRNRYPRTYILVQLRTSSGQIPKPEVAQSKVLTLFKALDAYLQTCWQKGYISSYWQCPTISILPGYSQYRVEFFFHLCQREKGYLSFILICI